MGKPWDIEQILAQHVGEWPVYSNDPPFSVIEFDLKEDEEYWADQLDGGDLLTGSN
jgi:hypothetical protein